jgi:hypothetical protein
MTKGTFLAVLVVVAFAAALFSNVGESGAAFHLMRIDGVMAGENGHNTVQYVELRMANDTQNFVATHVICFFRADGLPSAEFRFPTSVGIGSDGSSILVGTFGFDVAWPAGAPDFTFGPSNTTAIPANGGDVDHPIRSPGGKVSFGTDSATMSSDLCQLGFTPLVDSVAYGTGFPPANVDYGTKFASDLPTTAFQVLHLQGPVCIEFSAHPCASPRNNSVNYAVVDANASGNQPRNNAGVSGPVVDADGDGVGDPADICPATAPPSSTVDGSGCSQAQVDRDLDTICDPSPPSAGPAPGCTGTDNCPAWPNTAQNLPVWFVQPGDLDCDSITDSEEAFVGTDPYHACAATPEADDEGLPDAWPVDFDDDQRALLGDVTKYAPVYGAHADVPSQPYDVRFDLDGNGLIGLGDITKFAQVFGKTCTP